jgi:hypothetical protein
MRAKATLMFPILLLVCLAAAQVTPGLLKPAELKSILPDTFFFHGQRAPIDAHNTGGARFADGKLVLTARVVTSGYSADIAEKYQGYLITETRLKLGESMLAPGAYGVGFSGGKFVVMDVSGSDVFSVAEQTDDQLKRPRPLLLAAQGDAYRLYFGKKYVEFRAAQ